MSKEATVQCSQYTVTSRAMEMIEKIVEGWLGGQLGQLLPTCWASRRVAPTQVPAAGRMAYIPVLTKWVFGPYTSA